MGHNSLIKCIQIRFFPPMVEVFFSRSNGVYAIVGKEVNGASWDNHPPSSMNFLLILGWHLCLHYHPPQIEINAHLGEWSIILETAQYGVVTSSSPWFWSCQCASGFLLLVPPVPQLMPFSVFGQMLSSLLLGGSAIASKAAVDTWENKVSVENNTCPLHAVFLSLWY